MAPDLVLWVPQTWAHICTYTYILVHMCTLERYDVLHMRTHTEPFILLKQAPFPFTLYYETPLTSLRAL